MKSKNKIDFFLVGAARCGTTSLYNYLNNSPKIFLPKVKEPNFFSQVQSPKSEDYELPDFDKIYHSKIITSADVYDKLYATSNMEQLKGDTSPSYLWDKSTARRIYDHNPKAKILMSLRHPVDRAYSHYVMNYFTGVDNNKTFVEALNSKKNEFWGSCNMYLEMGYYYEQVKEYYKLFPKENIKILIYENWTKNLNEEIESVFNFLNVNLTDSVFKDQVGQNRIQPLKNMTILNFLRQNGIKKLIKNLVKQERIDNLKNRLFKDEKEIEKLNPELKNKLSKQFFEEARKLSELTQIDFNSIWF